MQCCNCPLFHSWNTESDAGAACAIFGDGWDSPFQYKNKNGTEIIGCYIEKAYINKVEAEISDCYEKEVQYASELMEKETSTGQKSPCTGSDIFI